MKKIFRFFKLKFKQRKFRKSRHDKLWDELIKNDNKCRQLRLQMARANKNASSRKDYKINDQKVRQIIYLSLQQIKIQNQLKYD
tara:strand:+ start:16093 stop:16344 length:252 start_codon:yes stop_codon:yes gene_type:complete